MSFTRPLDSLISALPLQAHPESWLALEDIGPARPYRKTFHFLGRSISRFHAEIASAPTGRMGIDFCIDLGIDGYLWKAEARKLYEIAYFASGNGLELGTFMGLSTSIMARALQDRGTRRTLTTCDKDASFSHAARQNVAARPGGDCVRFVIGDAAEVMKELVADRQHFGWIFVDHWHGYEATRDAANLADQLLPAGGLIMFHDFTDGSTNDPNHPHKVYQAVRDSIRTTGRYRFLVIVGSMGIFQKIA